MTTARLAELLGTDAASVEKIAPLLDDAAGVLADAVVPTEAEIHDVVAGTYQFDEKGADQSSDDVDRRLGEALMNVVKWRDGALVYLNGAAVLLRRAVATLSRFEAKKRVLAAFREAHPSRASASYYFTREKSIELPPDVPAGGAIAASPLKGKRFFEHALWKELAKKSPDQLAAEQIDLLLRLLAVPLDPRTFDTSGMIALCARAPERAGPGALRVLSRPDESAKSVDGESGALAIGIRRLVPKLPANWGERILRAALEAGWHEWIDRPLLDAPLAAPLREQLQREFGTRQDAAGNPYRPTEPWFYNLDEA